ncbi:MAG: hypothetical protein HZA79_17265 [Sphingobacteriales bacterium]|nr:hypothetical protein [Sphingobacteriales bacterium]
MPAVNNFSEYYKTISHTELLGILENPADYQPVALEAARKEWADRQLSEQDETTARQSLVAVQTEKIKQKEKVKKIEDKIKISGYALLETLNPIQPGLPSPEKIIRLIVLVFGGIFLYLVLSELQMHISIAKDFREFPIETILYFFPLILLPLALLAFWRKTSTGWTLLTIYLVFITVEMLWILTQSLLWKPSGNEFLDVIRAKPPVFTLLLQLIFFAGTLYTICRHPVREIFSISKERMTATIAITGLISFFLAYSSL